ncbi:hypothetical protein [Streptomyces sp. KR80]|uniref:hypothetical protein n=1 Tax=Streptomyces sp. KR80 TaxID=3457426 RepID=UPI003FD201C9
MAAQDDGEPPAELELTSAERGLWQAYRNGTEHDLRTGDPAEDDPGGDRTWGPERAVRAQVIALLLLNGPPAQPGRAAALKMIGCRITGELDLSNSEITVPFDLQDYRLEQPFRLVDCRAGTLIIDRCPVPRVDATRLVTEGDLSLKNCDVPQGLALPQARIGMDLTLEHLRLGPNQRGKALDADGMNVTQDLNADWLEVTGELSLRSARVGGSMSLRACRLGNPQGTALNAPRLVVEENLVFAPDVESPSYPDGRSRLIAPRSKATSVWTGPPSAAR